MDRVRLHLRAESGPPRISASTVARLRSDLARVRDEKADSVGLVTLEGEPGQFCEGLDLDILSTDGTDFEKGMASYRALLSEVSDCPRPVIALVDGVALGGGLGLLAAADMVVATPRSTFGLPETLIGLTPSVVFPYLVARIGVAKTRLLGLGLTPLSAADALRVGLVDEIAENLETAFSAHSKRFMRMDWRAMAHVKAIANAFIHQGDRLDAERRFSELLASAHNPRSTCAHGSWSPTVD